MKWWEQRLGSSGLANHENPSGRRHVQTCNQLEALKSASVAPDSMSAMKAV